MTDGTFDNLVVNNNLLIGETEPAAQLHVVSPEGISSKVFVESVKGSLLKVTAERDSASIGTENAFPLSINTNGLPRIQISSEGNVGVGTSPVSDALLAVNGTVKATAFQGDGSRLTGKVNTSGDTMTGPLTIQSNLSVSGNIGIGTTSPAAKLHIYSNDNYALKITNTALSKAAMMGVDGLGVWIEPSETNSSIRLNANPSLIGLYVKGTNGDVGIGTTSPTAKLEVAGGIQCSGNLSSQDGKVRRDFITWSTVENSSNPIHIKTNIPKKSNVMYRILVEGYNYGIAASINSDVVGYTYKDWETIYSAQTNNYANGVSISQYYSFDGYVVIKLTTSNTYCLGFSASAWFTNPPGNGFNISATVYHQATDL
jgi:hypothetical protein